MSAFQFIHPPDLRLVAMAAAPFFIGAAAVFLGPVDPSAVCPVMYLCINWSQLVVRLIPAQIIQRCKNTASIVCQHRVDSF
ncbi:hypothetical protein D3C75_1294540 [compost metagenome]